MPKSSKSQQKSQQGKTRLSHGEAGEDVVGNGGELHQVADQEHPPLTTQAGAVVADDENSLRGGERGPTLLEDHYLLEKIQHFDHERIPERIVHARGFGAHGFFGNYESRARITRADLFQRAGARIPALSD